MTVGAAAVAAEHEFFLMAFQKVFRKFGVAGKRVVAGIGGHIGEEIRVIAQKFIGNSAAFDRAGRVGVPVGIIGADVGPKGVGMPDEFRLRISL